MTVYFVSNNLVIDNIFYETDESLEEKRITRVLSVEGEKVAVKVAKKIKADVIYSSSYASSVSSAKYYSKRWDLPININSFLNDTRVGDMENRNIKMLRFMQERDFDFKFKHGESLNEVSKRMNIAMDRIIKKCGNKDIVVFTQKSAIMGYLLDYLDKIGKKEVLIFYKTIEGTLREHSIAINKKRPFGLFATQCGPFGDVG